MTKNEQIARLVRALQAIEKFGHSTGHGRGYTCANMAKEALEGVEDTYMGVE